MSELEIWRNTVQLHEAYAVFASEEQKTLFSQAGDRQNRNASFELMFADLFYALAAGELYAIGFDVSGMATDPPIQFPPHFFDGRPNISECQSDVITFQNWRFENVRIFKNPEKVSISEISCKVGSVKTYKVGRPSTYDLSKGILIEIFSENPLLKDSRASGLIDLFNTKYKARALSMGKPAIGLSDRTLREHLKRFRKESE